MRSDHRAVEHLDQMRTAAALGQKRHHVLKDAGARKPVKAAPDTVPVPEPFRQRPPRNIVYRAIMKRFEKQPVVFGFDPAPGQAKPKRLKRQSPVIALHFRRLR